MQWLSLMARHIQRLPLRPFRQRRRFHYGPDTRRTNIAAQPATSIASSEVTIRPTCLVQTPTEYELVFNLRTLRRSASTFRQPCSADRVIE